MPFESNRAAYAGSKSASWERHRRRRGVPIDRVAWRGRAWTIAALALPMPLLFHPPFLSAVVWPLIGIPPLA